MGGGAAVGSWAVAELGQCCLEVRFFYAFHKQLLDVLDGRLRQPIGRVVRASGVMEDTVILAVRLEGLTAELRPPRPSRWTLGDQST